MKFKQAEHDEFKAVIEEQGLDYSSLSFTKKKGWLAINHENRSGRFMYHRKSETQLSNDGRWLEKDKFFTKADNTRKEYDQFQSVLDDFRRWLKEMD